MCDDLDDLLSQLGDSSDADQERNALGGSPSTNARELQNFCHPRQQSFIKNPHAIFYCVVINRLNCQ